MSYRRQEITVT